MYLPSCGDGRGSFGISNKSCFFFNCVLWRLISAQGRDYYHHISHWKESLFHLLWDCESLLQFIYDAATKFCVEIACHRHGCCVLNRCVAYSKGKYREKLVTSISANGLFLAQDAFG